MKNTLFDTKGKRAAAVANFRNLLDNSGWGLIVKILDANIEIVTDFILRGKYPAEDGLREGTREELDQLRDRLETYKSFRDTPNVMITSLTETPLERPVMDPYQTVSEARQEREGVEG